MGDAVELDRPVAERPARANTSARGLTWLSVLAVTVPFLVIGIRFNLTGSFFPGGDAALADLHARDAVGLGQLVGPWVSSEASQPGPTWFYLLAVVRSVFGDSGTGLVAASLTLHALAAALLVLAVGRTRTWERPVLALIVVLLVVQLPATTFLQVWGPAAMLLPTALALVLAARACTGSLPALSGLAVVGTVLVQTDIRTLPLLALLVVVAATGIVRTWRHVGSGEEDVVAPARTSRRGRFLVLVGAVATVGSWVPPVWQQLRPGPRGGNLGRLAHEVLGSSPEPPVAWRAAVSGVGRALGLTVGTEPAGSVPLDVAGPSLGAALAVAAQLAAGAALIWAARRRGRPFIAALGLVVVIATVAAVFAARLVPGQLTSGSVLWVAVLPVLTLAGAAWLLVEGLLTARPRSRRRGHPALGAILVAAAVLAGVVLADGAGDLPSQPGVEAAAELVEQSVPQQEGEALVLEVRDPRTWQTVAGLADELERSDRQIAVGEPWVEAFGGTRTATGHETWRVTLVAVADAPAVPYGSVIGTVVTDLGETAVVLGQQTPVG